MATISNDTADELEQYFDDVRRDYSGRAMFGETCLGIVTDGSSWALRGELQEMLNDIDADDEDYAPLIEELNTILDREPRTDSMGLSTIFYWPSIQVED